MERAGQKGTPEYNDLTKRLAQSVAHQQAGAMDFLPIGGVGKGAAGVASALRPSAERLLMNEGVKLTPGQMAGGVAKSIEDKATSIPLAGDMITSARRRGIEDLNPTPARWNQHLAHPR